MKKISLILIILLFSVTAIAQITKRNYNIKTVEYGTFLSTAENQNGEWVMDGPPVEYISLFHITENIITQINLNDRYIYYIINEEHSKEKGRIVLDIVDENGGEYTMILDYTNHNLRFIYNNGTENLRITRFTYSSVDKTTWTEM